jgi:CII-binding regulator of phage lambda lysogenization HflD
MSLKEKIQDILDVNENESIIIDLIKNEIKHFKRDTNRVRYDLQEYYDDVITNRNELAQAIAIKGLSEKIIYAKIYGHEVRGFNPANENTELTKKICLALKCKREDIIKKVVS